MLNALRRIIGGELLGLLSPYHHFDPNFILRDGRWEPVSTALSIGFIVVANIIAIRLFGKRDLRSPV